MKENVFEALDNSAHNTSLREVIDKPNIRIAYELQEYTTGFENILIADLMIYIHEWKKIKLND